MLEETVPTKESSEVADILWFIPQKTWYMLDFDMLDKDT
jgi:hypothetical protein